MHFVYAEIVTETIDENIFTYETIERKSVSPCIMQLRKLLTIIPCQDIHGHYLSV